MIDSWWILFKEFPERIYYSLSYILHIKNSHIPLAKKSYIPFILYNCVIMLIVPATAGYFSFEKRHWAISEFWLHTWNFFVLMKSELWNFVNSDRTVISRIEFCDPLIQHTPFVNQHQLALAARMFYWLELLYYFHCSLSSSPTSLRVDFYCKEAVIQLVFQSVENCILSLVRSESRWGILDVANF